MKKLLANSVCSYTCMRIMWIMGWCGDKILTCKVDSSLICILHQKANNCIGTLHMYLVRCKCISKCMETILLRWYGTLINIYLITLCAMQLSNVVLKETSYKNILHFIISIGATSQYGVFCIILKELQFFSLVSVLWAR